MVARRVSKIPDAGSTERPMIFWSDITHLDFEIVLGGLDA